jgi:hypothetical protein
MKTYIPARIAVVEKNSFPDKETGQTIEFYTNYVKNSDGEMLQVNSKESFEAFEGKSGVCTIEISPRSNGGGFKLSLRGFSEGEESEPEIH